MTALPSIAKQPSNHGPLAGITIIDLTTARSGPTCVRQLVDLGADAIRVCKPGHVDLPGSDGWNLHRGVASIELDLQTADGLANLLRLVDDADVVVENYRPAVKNRLSIDPDTLLARNPRLVYGSISGFGQDGPYADRPGVDQIAQGLSGLMSVTGPPGSGPWRTGIAVSDTVAGTFLAQGIIAALFARERTGIGQWVHTSLLETMINIMDFQAARYLNEGDIPGQAGNDHPTLFPMGTYETADGNINIAASFRFADFASAVSHPEWNADPRYSSIGQRIVNRIELSAAVSEVLRTRTTNEWVTLLNDAGIPAGPVLAIDEVFADPQVHHLAMTANVEHPTGNPEITVLRHPVTFTDTPTRIAGPPRRPGADTERILQEN
jgi:crotonobetainyl-CoA:carnitine CoA-transferase CaiB-like acyl-CoA transferase